MRSVWRLRVGRLERASSVVGDWRLGTGGRAGRAFGDRRCGSSRWSKPERARTRGPALGRKGARSSVRAARARRRTGRSAFPWSDTPAPAASCGSLRWGHRTKRWLMRRRRYARSSAGYRGKSGASPRNQRYRQCARVRASAPCWCGAATHVAPVLAIGSRAAVLAAEPAAA